MKLGNAELPTQALIRRIDSDHANAKQRWQEMGSLNYLDAAAVTELRNASSCEQELQSFDFHNGDLDFKATLPPLSAAAVTIRFAERDRG